MAAPLADPETFVTSQGEFTPPPEVDPLHPGPMKSEWKAKEEPEE
jgi:hypothetical protein